MSDTYDLSRLYDGCEERPNDGQRLWDRAHRLAQEWEQLLPALEARERAVREREAWIARMALGAMILFGANAILAVLLIIEANGRLR